MTTPKFAVFVVHSGWSIECEACHQETRDTAVLSLVDVGVKGLKRWHLSCLAKGEARNIILTHVLAGAIPVEDLYEPALLEEDRG